MRYGLQHSVGLGRQKKTAFELKIVGVIQWLTTCS